MDKQREEFEAWYEEKIGKSICFKTYDNSYLRRDTDEAWQAWQQAQKMAVPDGFVVVSRILNEDLAFNMAISRIVKPPKNKDPIVNEIQLQTYTDNLYVCQESLITDYKAMIEAGEKK